MRADPAPRIINHRLCRRFEVAPGASPIVILSHHKCATSWLHHYLQTLAALNRLTFGITHSSRLAPTADIALISNAEYDFLATKGIKGVHVVRNPLSVIASAYFSHRNSHSLDGWPQLAVQRRLLREHDQSTGMFLTTAFLERSDFHRDAVGPLHGLRSWDYDDPAFVTVRMEDLVRTPARLLREALTRIGAATPIAFPNDSDFVFSRFSGGRQIGEADPASHYRQGGPDDWRAQLPEAVLEYVRNHLRPMLERFYPEALAQKANLPMPPASVDLNARDATGATPARSAPACAAA